MMKTANVETLDALSSALRRERETGQTATHPLIGSQPLSRLCPSGSLLTHPLTSRMAHAEIRDGALVSHAPDGGCIAAAN